MNFNKIKNLWIVTLVLILSACEPIIDEQYLENSTDVDGVELIATQSTPGGNKITLDLVTPGINGYWDYNLGKALTDKITFIYPIPGKATFTFTGTLGSEFFSKSIDVQIDQLDNALDQDWYDLVSEDTAAGKTWVYAGTPGNGAFWFMSAPGGVENVWSLWWNAGDCCAPDPYGKMHFDLNGAANYTYYSDAGASGASGSFVLDVSNKKLQIIDQPLMGGNRAGGAGNADGIYEIVSLTEDELLLYVSNSEVYGTGWTWVFKPE
ncbi:hypothetical protein [Lutibacter sp.]|jgi:hypothetical protein|uniref:hypothetical protein n=1 Tax=Lutibacter sp. TaxID=1925666 RepID=UPI001A302FE5|nr:hypothetical protein [Lutibacter sp.]MBI9041627.1 hypothetical protein [Lutibacter sp.]